MIPVEFIARLGTVENNTAAELDLLGIATNLMKRVGWTDVEVKPTF